MEDELREMLIEIHLKIYKPKKIIKNSSQSNKKCNNYNCYVHFMLLKISSC